ncbi:GAF domain-containing protein [Methyloversatilis thermotolerans]|uniref:GAF domain-containing protein n=1 Tax=Methyloversatilis thermotolerans TaxID=1346290 RepID=UPI0003820E31|nr:GAF domain-containing protein [Methyloversatilis thermotolerans]
MTGTDFEPPFGEADLTNCERELIHLAGSVQPHGALILLRESDLSVLQASESVRDWLGIDAADMLGRPLSVIGGDVARMLATQLYRVRGDELTAFQCRAGLGLHARAFEALLHRVDNDALVLELEAASNDGANADMHRLLSASVHRFSEATTVETLAQVVTEDIRALTGYDRVMVYRFDADGHGEIIAESRDPGLDTLLGHRYPASDIPQRARELYLRNRVRVLVDAAYRPSALHPRLRPDTGRELDMSMCHLRSMSPLHIEYLTNMGVTATLVASLVREGRLWGLIACHHYSPRRLQYARRTAVDVLAEVMATRLAAIENYVRMQVDMLVRQIEARLIDAASLEGDWRTALIRSARALLQPLQAQGLALHYEGEWLTAGELPSTDALQIIARHARAGMVDGLFACAALGRIDPALAALAPGHCGVLAAALSGDAGDLLIWVRPEQRARLTWAGNPEKQRVEGDPLTLSPRRSFETWTEIVRGSSAPWTRPDIALVRAIACSLRDVIMQSQAVRLLIAEHQIQSVRRRVDASDEPLLLVDGGGRLLYANEACRRLTGTDRRDSARTGALTELLAGGPLSEAFRRVLSSGRPWRGECTLCDARGEPRPYAVRMDGLPSPEGGPLGYIVLLTDLSDTRRTEAARRHFEETLSETGRAGGTPSAGMTVPDAVLGAILANASVAAMELSDAPATQPSAALIEELEASVSRAALLYARLRQFRQE